MMHRYLFLFVFITISFTLSSQEVISHLLFGPPSKNIVTKSKIKNGISLPFIDDFSSCSFGLDTNLWYSGNVFLNSTYPINPPTIGVATFDGLDSSGFAYDLSQNFSWGEADRLTSNPIDISTLDTVFLASAGVANLILTVSLGFSSVYNLLPEPLGFLPVPFFGSAFLIFLLRQCALQVNPLVLFLPLQTQ